MIWGSRQGGAGNARSLFEVEVTKLGRAIRSSLSVMEMMF